MQAIILAAGMGKRLGEFTKNNTKCMVKVNGVMLIDRLLEQLSKLNLKRVTIVIGYQGQKLREYIGQENRGMKIEYIENPIYSTTNNIYSLTLAKDILQADDTLLLESDLIFDDDILPLLANNSYSNLALVAKYENWMDGTMVRIDDDDNIISIVPKKAFLYEDIDFYYKTLNAYKFSKEFSCNEYVPFLEAYSKMMGNNEYYEQVLKVLVSLDNSTLKALSIGDRHWYEIDDVQDLDIASTLFSNQTTKYYEYHKRYGGFWRFPKLMDYCYLVNPFFPTKRMKDELRYNFDTLLTQYPSGMYVNSLLAGKYFGVNQDYIVVGNGAAELIKIVMEEHTSEKVGVIYPTFDEYPNRLNPNQIVAFVSNKKDFRYSAQDLIDFFSINPISMLLLINPDNPSGNYIEKYDLLKLVDWCSKKGISILVDESFVDFTLQGKDNSILDNDILSKYPMLMVMKSISKSYGVPGLRLGVLVSGNTAIIKKLKKEVSIWNINSFAEYYMQIFGKYEEDYDKACKKFIEEREIFFNELQSIDYLHVMPSDANYFLCEVTKKYTSSELTQKLIENDVIISNCGLKHNMEGKNLIRLAVRDRKDNAKLIDILKKL